MKTKDGLPYPTGTLRRNSIWQIPAVVLLAVVTLRFPVWFTLLAYVSIAFTSAHLGLRSINAPDLLPTRSQAWSMARLLWVTIVFLSLFLVADLGYAHRLGSFLYPSEIPGAGSWLRWGLAITQWVTTIAALVQAPLWAILLTMDSGGPVRWKILLTRFQQR